MADEFTVEGKPASPYRVVRMGRDRGGNPTPVGDAVTYDDAAAVLTRKWRLDWDERVSMRLHNQATGKSEHRYMTRAEFKDWATKAGLV